MDTCGCKCAVVMKMTEPELHILATPEDAAQAAAAFVADLAETRIAAEDRFTIALSGGYTPRYLYELMASPPYVQSITWERWYVFWGDERCVPPDHQDSNYRMTREALLNHVPIPAKNIYPIRGDTRPKYAAEEYEQQLYHVFTPSKPAFDLILLGIGDDGHIASLFDGTDAIHENRRPVVANWVPQLQAYRITFTFPLINAAQTIAFIVTDESKSEVIKQVLEPTSGDPILPASQVKPTSGVVHWFLTRAATRRLERRS